MTDSLDNRIHRIAAEKIDQCKTELDGKIQSVAEEIREVNDKLGESKLSIERSDGQRELIRQKLDSIYGNGTGRKGAIERMEEKQEADTRKLEEGLKQLSNRLDSGLLEVRGTIASEGAKQQNFRHEIRGHFETMNLLAATESGRSEARSKTNKTWQKWILWVAAGGGAIFIELVKELFHSIFK